MISHDSDLLCCVVHSSSRLNSMPPPLNISANTSSTVHNQGYLMILVCVIVLWQCVPLKLETAEGKHNSLLQTAVKCLHTCRLLHMTDAANYQILILTPPRLLRRTGSHQNTKRVQVKTECQSCAQCARMKIEPFILNRLCVLKGIYLSSTFQLEWEFTRHLSQASGNRIQHVMYSCK